MKASEFVTKCLSESGEISFGRTASAVALAFCLGWDTSFVVFAMRHINFAHMGIHDVLPSAGALSAQAAFCLTFYGTNKATAIFNSRKEGEH